MSAPRIFVEAALIAGTPLRLPDEAFRHVVQVLRMSAGEALILFNGDGDEYPASLESVGRREATVLLGTPVTVDRESPLTTTLVQGISKGDRMDWAVQKAVELGVSAIAPVITERCNIKVDSERWEKKLEHWRAVIVSACEQSGRNRLPRLYPVMRLDQWLLQPGGDLKLALDPTADLGLRALPAAASIDLLVGPEGGLSPADLAMATASAYRGLRLGPRVLRTETAGVAALATLGALYGDLGTAATA